MNEFLNTTNFNNKEKVTHEIIFVVGGSSFEEAKEITEDKNTNLI